MSAPRQQQPGGSPRPNQGPPPRTQLDPDSVVPLLPQADLVALLEPPGYPRIAVEGEKIGKGLATGRVTRSQVRNVLDSFQPFALTWPPDAVGENETLRNERIRQIARLPYNVIYLASREINDEQRKRQLLGLARMLGLGVDHVLAAPDAQAMRHRYLALVDIVEAITAYHSLYSRN